MIRRMVLDVVVVHEVAGMNIQKQAEAEAEADDD